MAWRITEDDLRALCQTSTSLDLAAFIDVANALMDKVVAADTDSLLGTALAKQIEVHLAAHFYSLRDPLYTSKSTGRASGSFQVGSGNGLMETAYGRNAVDLDVTGYLRRLTMPQRPKVKSGWLGKPKSEQIDYEDRD